ncbi:hypothetical protein LOK49_LG14G00016 [Camellia lanceoleosa]|uniref:Uncharacterized protein n=1 Tax=Camellia lanceoleosa TaxID=1840588 RepID=A0ACC0FCC9_9ERIC|nr:hypothetical protein LOK49_LG14G00016 [Camellia lanceoleosa]
MTKEVGYLIGNKIGSTVDVEYGADGMAIGRYLRIRVTLNVAKPLRRGMKLAVHNREAVWVDFKYERLPNFCGVLGHSEKECNSLLSHPKDGTGGVPGLLVPEKEICRREGPAVGLSYPILEGASRLGKDDQSANHKEKFLPLMGDGGVLLPSQAQSERERLLANECLTSGPFPSGLVGLKVASFQKKPNQDDGLCPSDVHEASSLGPNLAMNKGALVSGGSSVPAFGIGPLLPSQSMNIETEVVLTNPALECREEPLVSLVPTGRVGKKWKKIPRTQQRAPGSGAVHAGVKRSLIADTGLADDGGSQEKRLRIENDRNFTAVELMISKMKAVAVHLQDWNRTVLGNVQRQVYHKLAIIQRLQALRTPCDDDLAELRKVQLESNVSQLREENANRRDENEEVAVEQQQHEPTIAIITKE